MKKHLKAFALILGFGFLSFKIPSIHYSLLRSYIANKTVYITNSEGTSGGTGIHVKARSGKTYLLTNDHVCGLGNNKNEVYVSFDNSDRLIPRRIVEKSIMTDLCLVEGMPEVEGISLAKSASYGSIVYQVGHPRLMPITLTQGEFISKQMVRVLIGPIFTEEDKMNCSLPKNSIIKVDGLFGEVELCTIKVMGNLSNIPTLPGNSGSPIVNEWGKLVALTFAGDNRINWGISIPLEDIERFLKIY